MSAARADNEIETVQMDADDGFEAFVSGLGIDENPFPPNEVERQHYWIRGWFEASSYINGMKDLAA